MAEKNEFEIILLKKLQQVGSSLMIVLPKSWTDENNLHLNDEVKLGVAKKYIQIMPKLKSKI